YDFIYWFGSNQTHANARAAMEYMGITDTGKPKYKLGPDLKHSSGALSMACDLMIRAVGCIVKLFGIPDEEAVKELTEQYARIFGKRDSPLTASS
ncbi:MAG: hypothetical protein ACE5JO_05115, partial [Candidatus Binatia bacterium]